MCDSPNVNEYDFPRAEEAKKRTWRIRVVTIDRYMTTTKHNKTPAVGIIHVIYLTINTEKNLAIYTWRI